MNELIFVSANSNRIFYYDVLRVIAILSVILLHVTGHVGEIMNYNIQSIYSFSGYYETFANNFFRIGVDLFLMISGALLLGRNWNVKSFFEKRIPRIAKPFLFWSLIFSIVLILSSYFIPNINFVSDFGILTFFKVFFETLFFKAPGSVVYWFFWIMIYVYMLMPLLNRWLNNVKLINVEYFLIISIIFISIIYPLNNPYLNLLSDFISPLALVILGYYLRYSERKIFNNSFVSAILIVVSSVVMLLYSYSVVNSNILFVFHRYSLLVVLLSIGVYCFVKSSTIVNNASGIMSNAISSIAMCSYGMYLIHSQLIMVTRKIFHLSSNFIFDYILLFLVGFLLSWLIMIILAKIPIINELIGVK